MCSVCYLCRVSRQSLLGREEAKSSNSNWTRRRRERVDQRYVLGESIASLSGSGGERPVQKSTD